MAKVIPAGFVDFALKMTRVGDPEPYVVTFGARILAPPYTDANLSSMVTALSTRFPSALATVERMVGLVARVGQDGGIPLQMEAAMDVAGTGTGARLPQNCAMLVTKLTSTPGRRGRGRLFWPSLAESDVTDTGEMTSVPRTSLQSLFSNFLADINTGTAATRNTDAMAVFHSSGPATPAIVTALRVEGRIATQRRRMRR